MPSDQSIRTVRNVVMANIMEEKAPHPSEQGSINGGSGPTKEGPFTFPIVRDCRVGVMQESEHDNPRNQGA